MDFYTLCKYATKDAIVAAGKDAASQHGNAMDFFLFSSLLEKKKSQDEVIATAQDNIAQAKTEVRTRDTNPNHNPNPDPNSPP
jgi:hypothetical protein